MKKFIYIIFLLLLIGCEKKENEVFISKDVMDNLYKLEKITEKIYSNERNIKYKILGEGKDKEKILINGKELVIPIYSSFNKNNDFKINMSVIYNFENKKSYVVIDNLFIKFNEFQKIIEKSKKWLSITKNTDFGKYKLEKKINNNSVEISFPQGKKRRFYTFLIFDYMKNDKLIFLDKENKMKIQFSEKEINVINKGLNNEGLKKIILKNINFFKKELNEIERNYNKLNSILNKEERL